MSYSRFIKRLGRKDKQMKNCINYSTQIDHLMHSYDTGERIWDKTKLMDILETAGFSNRKPDGESIKYVKDFMESVKKPRNK
jgi:hypothetical protein